MRKIWIACGILCVMTAATAQARETVLDKDTNIVIEARGPVDNTEAALKDLLGKYLLRALKRDSLAGPGETVRFIVTARAQTWKDLPRRDMQSLNDIDAFEIDTTAPGTVRITGATVLSTGFGVTCFLERYMGVVWLFPGELGTHIPEQTEVRLPAKRERHVPRVLNRLFSGIRGARPAGTKRADAGLLMAMRGYFTTYDYYKSLRLRHISYASHAMIRIFPVKETREKHPELLPLKADGTRHIPPTKEECGSGAWQAWHPCYTHPKTIEIATRKAVEFITGPEGADLTFSLGINDGRLVQCQCERCRAIGWPEAYYEFVLKVAHNVKAYYPPYMVGVLGYGDVGTPPADLKLPDNVLVLTTGALQPWEGKARHLDVMEYLESWGYWIPNIRLKSMKHNAQLYRRYGVNGVYATQYPLWAFDGPRVYIYANLLWDPDFDVDAGLNRYCSAGFGQAWQPIAEFFRLWSSVHDRDIPEGRRASLGTGDERFLTTVQLSKVPAGLWPKARRLIEQARTRVNTEKHKARLHMLDMLFSYAEAFGQMYDLREACFDTDAAHDWPAIVRRGLALRIRRDEIKAELMRHPEWYYDSGVTPERLFGEQWEERGGCTILYENENAIRTALFHVNEAQNTAAIATLDLPEGYRDMLHSFNKTPLLPQKIVPRPYWYPDARWSLMRYAYDGPKLTFSVGKGGEKGGYLVAAMPVRDDRHYLFEPNLTGRDGQVELKITNHPGYATGELHLRAQFADGERTLKRRFLLKPVDTGRQPQHQFLIHIVWHPESDTAEFSGDCLIHEVDFCGPERLGLNPGNGARRNLLSNGDFEEGEAGPTSRGKVPEGWARYFGDPAPLEIADESRPGSPGRQCLKIHPTKSVNVSGLRSRMIPLDPSRPLTISAYLRHGGDAKHRSKLAMAVAFYDKKQEKLIFPPGSHRVSLNARARPQWTQASQTFVPWPADEPLNRSKHIPRKARLFEVWIYVPRSTVPAWVDDLVATQEAQP